jgi:hypothetical protein
LRVSPLLPVYVPDSYQAEAQPQKQPLAEQKIDICRQAKAGIKRPVIVVVGIVLNRNRSGQGEPEYVALNEAASHCDR